MKTWFVARRRFFLGVAIVAAWWWWPHYQLVNNSGTMMRLNQRTGQMAAYSARKWNDMPDGPTFADRVDAIIQFWFPQPKSQFDPSTAVEWVPPEVKPQKK